MVGYAFDFRAYGYPVWPLLIVGLSFAGYVRLRPPTAAVDSENERQERTRDAVAFLILAILTSAFLLEKRGEVPFTPVYFLHLSTLTFFQLLVPFIIAFACDHARPLVTTLATLALMAVMIDGTYMDPVPVIQYFQAARAYTPGDPLPKGAVLPMDILPPPDLSTPSANATVRAPH